MKKILVTIAIAAAITQLATASVNISFGLGTMYSGTTTGSSTFPSGGLINLLAVTNGQTWASLPSFLGYSTLNEVFANTTSGFAPTGTYLVGQLGNDNGGGPGVALGNYIYSYSGSFVAGNELMTVAYPTLTLSSLSPGNSTTGFFYRTSSTNTASGADIAWVAPADGGTYSLAALTLNLSGDVPNDQFTSGSGATGTQGFTTVPEPSTYALLAMSALGLGGYVVRRRNRS